MSTTADPQSRQALEEAAASCARLIDALRTTEAPAGLLGEVSAAIDALAARLAQHAAPGPHSQSAHGLSPQDFFRTPKRAAHEVMPFSPVIGRSNPVSARFTFDAVDGRIEGHGTIPVRFVGAPQTAHGGYVATVLDELMGVVNFLNGEGAFTGTMTVRYHRPTPIGQPLELHAEMLDANGRKIRSRAEIRCRGEVTASAEAVFIRPKHAIAATHLESHS